MIPKIIHYCWFGRNPLPKSALKCISSWKKYFPDYEIKEWNEDNYDITKNEYIACAYTEKKYAFVSDYTRFDILYQFGGLYFDVDVEVIQDMSPVLAKGAFMGCERKQHIPDDIFVAPGLGMGAEPQMEFLRDMMELYDTFSFYDKEGNINTKTIVSYTTDKLKELGLRKEDTIQKVAGFYIYPWRYFCPMDYKSGRVDISQDTYTIHHYMASWHSRKEKFKFFLQRLLGPKITMLIVKWKTLIRRG